LLDGFEVTYGFDPLVVGQQGLDPDGDGLTNLQEQTLGTNPTLADTDGDGFSDGAEVLAGTDPNNPLDFPAGGDSVPTMNPLGTGLMILMLLAAARKVHRRRGAG